MRTSLISARLVVPAVNKNRLANKKTMYFFIPVSPFSIYSPRVSRQPKLSVFNLRSGLQRTLNQEDTTAQMCAAAVLRHNKASRGHLRRWRNCFEGGRDWLCRNLRGIGGGRHNQKAWDMFGQKRAGNYAARPGDSQRPWSLLCARICGLRRGFAEALFAAIIGFCRTGFLRSKSLIYRRCRPTLRSFLNFAMSCDNSFGAT
jgi:hypothetical protein